MTAYVDKVMTESLPLWRESVLNDLWNDRSIVDIADDLSFYEGLDIYEAERLVELVQEGF